MPRKPRFYLPDVPVHVVQRGHNGQRVFLCDGDCGSYLRFLAEAAHSSDCVVHAYVLMPDHVHLLLTPATKDAVSRMIQYLGRNYVSYFNRRYGRSGTLWEGRHKGSVISAEDYFLPCSRYIEANPVRAGIVDSPEKYAWSSYHANAAGTDDPVVTPHAIYLSLGEHRANRIGTYRSSFSEEGVPADKLRIIRESTQTGTPLGDTGFKRQIELALQRKVGHRTRGRPRNAPAPRA